MLGNAPLEQAMPEVQRLGPPPFDESTALMRADPGDAEEATSARLSRTGVRAENTRSAIS